MFREVGEVGIIHIGEGRMFSQKAHDGPRVLGSRAILWCGRRRIL